MKENPQLNPIGVIHSPYNTIEECHPYSQSREQTFRLEVFPEFAPALQSVETCTHILVLYWMHHARRDLLTQGYRWDNKPHGTFALRSPHRPNPIALSTCELVLREGRFLTVQGLDCIEGTPLLDIKPCFATHDGSPDARVGWWEKRTGKCPQ
ncbi:MAG: tRNA (N6-threonylcarbamoyladenosine(37)-N6)-methyltransferase TrmO [Candidatus Cloacimonetes bacterium]|nr:tRNA (N6-threonylcarbamoyladenosine(37)-N6)-methyltransferase TrmO [Candidatus Cloacimonadota bacterium]